ncbi:MAG TPA: nucleoside-diphosphate sugar epimerase/dehydratase [Actinomycetota bacterium]|nr:nucleoside-diphosphate sugar epimerase/dehydratase [Actinomycetota bacterium]
MLSGTVGPLAPARGGGLAERLRRDAPLAASDLGVAFFSYLLTLALRFDGSVPDRYWSSFWRFLPIALAIHLLVHRLCGLYDPMWRYASVQEARRIVLAGAVGGAGVVLASLVVGWLTDDLRALPLSVTTFGAVLTMLGSGAIRFQSRLFATAQRPGNGDGQRVLIVGAGSAGSMILKDLLRSPSLGLRPVGLVDDDRRKLGRRLHGIPVLGPRAAIPALVEELHADLALLAIPTATSELVREVAALCERARVTVKALPGVHELVGGKVSARDIRDLRIEDLLGRKQIETDLEAVAGMLRGRRVLVTGAGGSIGSEIARQVASIGPAELVLLDHDETHLHDVVMSLEELRASLSQADGVIDLAAAEAEVQVVLADIRDRERVFAVFMRHRPEIVFHAAAHKHVPMLEVHPEEALATNVIGTANLADAAVASGTERFVLISTDKAINPASVMGASKWMAEQVVRSLQNGDSVLCAVRFGNVLGSRGSVIPTFFRQIAAGGPVTVTDPNMTRYFMSVQEAVQLVLQAAALSVGGEVFTLDMGEPVRILDLAERLIRLSGRIPRRDVPIEIIGRRPGEKTVEDIVAPDEEPVPSGHPSIVVSRPPVPDRAAVHRALAELEHLVPSAPPAELAARMKALARETGSSPVARAPATAPRDSAAV